MSHRSNICLEEPACVAAPEVPCGGVCDDDGVPCDFVVPESGCCNPCVPSASEPAMAECCSGSPASANVPRQRSQGHIQQQCYNCSCGRPDCVPMKKVVSVTHPRSQFAPKPIILITSPTMNTPPPAVRATGPASDLQAGFVLQSTGSGISRRLGLQDVLPRGWGHERAPTAHFAAEQPVDGAGQLGKEHRHLGK